MSKLKSIQEQIQVSIEKGINTVEEQHKTLATKSFEFVEKVEAEAKTSVQSLKDLHNETVVNMYEFARNLNKKLGGYASEVVGKIDGEIETAVEKAEEVVAETKEALAEKVPAKKAPAKKAAKAEEATA